MNWIKTTSVIFLITLSLLLALEMSARLFYDSPSFNVRKFINSKPAPFRDDINFSIVAKNLYDCPIHDTAISKDNIPFFVEDYSCAGKTTIKSKRVTKPNILSWDKTIHVFGGSTTFGSGVVDEETIPSLLQKRLVNNNIRVINYGYPSLVAFQQNLILKKEEGNISKDDIVIYYDGGNDFWLGVMLSNASGTFSGFNVINEQVLIVAKIKRWLNLHSELYQVLSDIKNGVKKQTKCALITEDLARRNIQSSAVYYASMISQAKEFVEAKGAKFYHFYQPTLYDVSNPTTYEKFLFKQDYCWETAGRLRLSYTNAFLKKSPISHDLSTIFSNKDLFYDFIHVSALGNRIAAKHILDVVFDDSIEN